VYYVKTLEGVMLCVCVSESTRMPHELTYEYTNTAAVKIHTMRHDPISFHTRCTMIYSFTDFTTSRTDIITATARAELPTDDRVERPGEPETPSLPCPQIRPDDRTRYVFVIMAQRDRQGGGLTGHPPPD